MNEMHRGRAIAWMATLLLALTGCDRTDNRAQSADPPLVTESQQAAQRAAEAGKAALAETEQAARRAADASKAAGAAAAAQLKEAGEQAAVITARAAESAREATGKIVDQLEDALIVAKVTTGLAADKNMTALKIKVDSRDGVVTLTGPAPSEAARARAEEIARNVKGVTSVNNQLTVTPPAG